MQPSVSTYNLSYEAPAKSVTTFKMTHTIARKSPDLVVKGNFELGRKGNFWSLVGGSRWNGGLNLNYVRSRSLSGFVKLHESKITIMQNVTVPWSRRYYASAWYATGGSNTKFRILLNGKDRTEVAPCKGYLLYGVNTDAQRMY